MPRTPETRWLVGLRLCIVMALATAIVFGARAIYYQQQADTQLEVLGRAARDTTGAYRQPVIDRIVQGNYADWLAAQHSRLIALVGPFAIVAVFLGFHWALTGVVRFSSDRHHGGASGD